MLKIVQVFHRLWSVGCFTSDGNFVTELSSWIWEKLSDDEKQNDHLSKIIYKIITGLFYFFILTLNI